MRLLWTVANWKRTGPVEPSLDLAMAMDRRGHEVLVGTGMPVGSAPDDAGASADARGLTRLDLGLTLRKHVGFLANRRDARRLADHLRARPPDVVVATLRNDHRIAAAALARAGVAAPVVRLWFDDGAAPPSKEEARLLASAARVVVFGERPRATLVAAGVKPSRIERIAPPLDVERIRRAATATEAWRARLRAGISSAGVAPALFGVVARVQPHRRFERLWEAAKQLKDRRVPFLVTVIGRGTSFDEVAREPVESMGLTDVVRFAGYLRGEDYASALAALDAQLLLVPGSDPTVRALREGMALGVPSVATRMGLLPDIVEDGRTGLLVDDTSSSLAAAMERLVRDEASRRAMGAAAAARAEREFSLPVEAERFEGMLEALASPRTGASAPRTSVASRSPS